MDALRAALDAADPALPLLVCGTSFAFVHWLDALEASWWYDQDPLLILQYDELVDGLTGDAVRDAARRWIDFDFDWPDSKPELRRD